MVPVWKESSFSKDRALCENESDSKSVIRTDFRSAVENEYTAEGMTASGKRNNEGVLHDKDTRATRRGVSLC